jgi:ribosomal protein S8E
VNAVAVTQLQGRPHAVTTSNDQTVRVWDLNTAALRATLTGHTSRVSAVAMAQVDGRPHAITTGSGGSVRVWDLTNGTHHTTFIGHTGRVNAVAVTQLDDEPHAMTTGDDRTVRVWNLNTAALRATLTGHTSRVTAVAVARIDRRPHAITTGDDRTVRVWDLNTGALRATLTGHTSQVNAVAVAQVNGRPHAITTGHDGTVRVWDLIDSRVVDVFSQPLPGLAITTYGDFIVLACLTKSSCFSAAAPEAPDAVLGVPGQPEPVPTQGTRPVALLDRTLRVHCSVTASLEILRAAKDTGLLGIAERCAITPARYRTRIAQAATQVLPNRAVVASFSAADLRCSRLMRIRGSPLLAIRRPGSGCPVL